MQTTIDANRHKNLQIKTALLEQLEIAAKSSDWKTTGTTIKEIQGKWLKTGAVAEDKREDVEGKFKSLVDKFYERRTSFYEDLNQMMAQKEDDFKAFVSETHLILEKAESSKSLQTAIKQRVEEWKELGKLERSKHNQYWQELQTIFKSHTQRVRKLESKQRNQSSKEVQEEKEKIISQLEEVSKKLVPDVDLTSIRDNWKRTGRLSKKQDFELNGKFRFLVDLISEKQFLNQLVMKKGARLSSDEEKNKLRIKLVYDLLKRDQTELGNFEENLGKFNTSSGLNDMLIAKLDQQKRKVEVKKKILDELKRLN